MKRIPILALAYAWLLLEMASGSGGPVNAASAQGVLKGIAISRTTLSEKILLRISGGYTFKTARLTDNTFFVDLKNVTPDGVARRRRWSGGLLASYRLLAYTDAGGQPVLRVQVESRRSEPFRVQQEREGLRLLIGADQAVTGSTAPLQLGAGARRPGTSEGEAKRTQPVIPSSARAEVSGVFIQGGAAGETLVDISTTRPLAYRVLKLQSPPRLVVDLEEASNAAPQPLYATQSPVLKRVRVRQFRKESPAVVRVVADLVGNPIFDVHAQPGGVRIELRPRAVASQTAVPQPPVATKIQPRDTHTRPLPELARNPFESETRRREVPARRAIGPTPATATRAAGPAPVPFSALGYTEKAGGQRQAYVAADDQIYTVHEGETFADKYKLLKITPTLIEIENEEVHQRTELPFAHEVREMASAQPPALEAVADRVEKLERRLESLEKQFKNFVDTEATLTTLPLPAESPRRLSDVLGHDETWTAEGQSVVYANGRELLLAKSDGTASRKLVAVAGIPGWSRWSADGRLSGLTLADPKTNSTSLWKVSAGGTNLHALLPEWRNSSFDWSPAEKYFVFESAPDEKANAWVIRGQGSLFRRSVPAPSQLTREPMRVLAPVPSQDGKKLFVVGALARDELLRYDSGSRQFQPYLSGISAEGMDFSRDGQELSFVAYPEGALWRSKSDGTGRLQLTYPPMRAFLPRWSPDGKRIAFAATTPGKPWSVYVVSADGGSPEQLTAGERNEGEVGWSPDGHLLVFGSMYGFGGPSPAIYLLDLETRATFKLPGSDGLYSPRWSPDGRYIAAKAVDSEKLALFDFKTQKWTELANLSVAWKSWSRDGTYIYFDLPAAREPALYRVRISDAKLERVVSLRGFKPASTFGPWFSLAPDDSPIVIRETPSQTLYALDWQLQ